MHLSAPNTLPIPVTSSRRRNHTNSVYTLYIIYREPYRSKKGWSPVEDSILFILYGNSRYLVASKCAMAFLQMPS